MSTVWLLASWSAAERIVLVDILNVVYINSCYEENELKICIFDLGPYDALCLLSFGTLPRRKVQIMVRRPYLMQADVHW